jgi:hypothetical protein
MTLKSPKTLIGIIDTLASGVLSYAQAARVNGVSERTFWHWIKQSQQDADPDLVVEFLGEQVPFARAANAARRIAVHEARGRMEMRGVLGHDEPIFYNGMPTWKPDPRCVGMSEEDRDLLGYPKDGLLRDANGCCIQNTIHHEPPVALALRVVEAAFPKEYRPGINSTVDVSHSISGVQHVQKSDYAGGPPRVPPPPPPPRPTLLPELAVIFPESEPEDDDLADLIGPVGGPDGPPVEPEPEPEGDLVETNHLAPEPAPLAIDEAPRRAPRNALEADLFQRLDAARNKPRA